VQRDFLRGRPLAKNNLIPLNKARVCLIQGVSSHKGGHGQPKTNP
jgi:hypothetical protein